MKLSLLCGPLITCLVVCGNTLPAGEWPQILGPDRDGQAVDEQLADGWESVGPPLLWRRAVGRGYAGAAVKNRWAILFHRIGDEEIVEAVDVANGRTLWKAANEAHFTPSIFPAEDGPLCVPLIEKDRVFVFGGGGDLQALELETGRKLWRRPLYQEYRNRGGTIDFGYFGAGSTPILEAGRLLVNVGGQKNSGIIALDPENGNTLWEATDEGASYSAPVAHSIAGERHVIFVTRYHTISLDPVSGRVRFRFPFGRRGPTVNAASPLITGNLLFTTASYGVGARLTRLDAREPKEVWGGGEVLSSQYNTPVLHQNYLYGTDGRADLGIGSLRCVELRSGRIAWSIENFGVAAIILADEKLLIMKADGELILANPSPRAFEKLAASKLTDGTVRALPALADGRLLVRDESAMYCFDLGAKEK